MQHRLSGTGIPVGSGQGCEYRTVRARFSPADLLLLYTNGVTDAVVDGHLLGVDGVQHIVFDAGPCLPAELIARICSELSSEPNSANKDDIALLAISFGNAVEEHDATFGGLSERECSLSAHAI